MFSVSAFKRQTIKQVIDFKYFSNIIELQKFFQCRQSQIANRALKNKVCGIAADNRVRAKNFVA
ncbi:hypothetical protein Talka_02325 [Tepidimonas alkaliphilus]|uniref:Uncharacterized protein n=1 Tax=Tepidimonas alkaliphilus TaxID=2588942 RepID=A0A554W3L4_9BURK|nr:hypothetical protein Talka_02325 [Tepidimonas alkaliphilus]